MFYVGKGDLETHLNSKLHKKNIQDATSKSLSTFFIKIDTPDAFKVWVIEGTLAFHTVKHHNSYKSMDCTSPLMNALFDDSNSAKKISMARTKTEAVINSVLAPHSIEVLVNELQSIPFISISTDASNFGNKKVFPLIIQYFDYTQEGLQIRLLELENTQDERPKQW